MVTMDRFSIKDRAELSRKAVGTHFDLIVIGGGITGAGIVLDAASRGMKVLLIEKLDFASGTSSKSTKLIHGGLRYLKQLEIGLVRETGTERAIVHNIAPHLVHPEKMLLPIFKNGSFSKWSASLAISVYDFLAGVKPKDRKRSLNKSKAIEAEPLLDASMLKSAIEYSEYRTDDARLCFENLNKAQRLGAVVMNYCEVKDLIYTHGKISGVKAYDAVLECEVAFHSSYVVSAAGPWVDKIRSMDHVIKGKHLRLTKGIHLVFDHEKLPVQQSVYFDDFDKGRMLFAIPRQGVTYVGTTDTDYKGDMDRVVCTDEDVSYVLDAVNRVFNVDTLEEEDVISSWAGLRPLIAEEGKAASEVSRKDEIFVSDSGLISIAGGKLTGYRKMAEKMVDLIDDIDADIDMQDCQTKSLKLTEDAFRDYKEVLDYTHAMHKRFEEEGLTWLMAKYLVSTYGKLSKQLLNSAVALASKWPDDEWDKRLLRSEIIHCVEYESCWQAADFFDRRTGMLYFDPHRLNKHFDFILDQFKQAFGWSESLSEKYFALAKQYKDDYIF